MLRSIAGLFLLSVCTGSAFLLPHTAFRQARTTLGSCQYHYGASKGSIAATSIARTRVRSKFAKIYAHAALGESSTAHDVIERFGANLKGKTALVTG